MTISGKKPSMRYIETELSTSVNDVGIFGIEVDTENLSPYAEAGDLLIIDPSGVIKKRTKILVRTETEMFVARYLDIVGSKLICERMDTDTIETHDLETVIGYEKISSVTSP